MHPLLQVGLGIATGGLSCAAIGIHRGVTWTRMRKAREASMSATRGAEFPKTNPKMEDTSPIERPLAEVVGTPVDATPPSYSEIAASSVRRMNSAEKY